MHIMLIDCYNIAHAAFHSMGELDYHGRQTGVMFGFMLRMLQLAKTYETNQFIFCWDSQHSIRKIMWPAYKKKDKVENYTTSETIDYMALHDQMDELRKYVLYKLGFSNVLLYAGLEADDVVALVIQNSTIPDAWLTNGVAEFLIISTDKDLYQ
ncbi:hypothetical protein LCGC14_1331820, partial [marine sediment metagenome]